MPAKMNPFEVKTKPADRYYMDWQKLYPRPYDKNEVDPYTRLRIILMNGTEYEANWFSHQFHRHCTPLGVDAAFQFQQIRIAVQVVKILQQSQVHHLHHIGVRLPLGQNRTPLR